MIVNGFKLYTVVRLLSNLKNGSKYMKLYDMIKIWSKKKITYRKPENIIKKYSSRSHFTIWLKYI